MMSATKTSTEKVRTTVKKVRTRWQTAPSVMRFVIFGLVLLLLLARWMAPYEVMRYVNRTLNRHPEYGGKVGQVRLHIIRGAYSIDHVDIVKKTGKVPVPFVSAKTVEFSVNNRLQFLAISILEVPASKWPMQCFNKSAGTLDLLFGVGKLFR